MANRKLIEQVHMRQLPLNIIAEALPKLRPTGALQFTHVRNEFVKWMRGCREEFASWQDAWNTWVHASCTHPGTLRVTVTCTQCHGKLFVLRHSQMGMCPTCLGRRIERVSTTASYIPPPNNL